MIAGNITSQPFYMNLYKKSFLPNCEFVHKNGFYFVLPSKLESGILIDGFFAAKLKKNDK